MVERNDQSDFDLMKHVFFKNLGLELRQAVGVQKKFGLFEKKLVTTNSQDHAPKKTLERKHQAPEHMLVVTARTKVLADWLGLSSKTTYDLSLAASLHDAFKAQEREITARAGFNWDSFRVAEVAEGEALLKLGVSKELIELSSAAGHPINEAQKKLEQVDLSESDWAWIILHYVDMASRGVEWATYDPIEARLSHDEKLYTGFDESAVGKIEGHPDERGFEAMRRTGKGAQQRISTELSSRQGREIDPKNLLLMVDKEIKRRIETISVNINEE